MQCHLEDQHQKMLAMYQQLQNSELVSPSIQEIASVGMREGQEKKKKNLTLSVHSTRLFNNIFSFSWRLELCCFVLVRLFFLFTLHCISPPRLLVSPISPGLLRLFSSYTGAHSAAGGIVRGRRPSAPSPQCTRPGRQPEHCQSPNACVLWDQK